MTTRTSLKSILVLLPCILLLSACASMSPNGLPSRSDNLPGLPRLEDAQSEAMLQRVAHEYEHWLAEPASYLNTPAQTQSWPCEVEDNEKNKLAGMPNWKDPKLLAAYTQAQQNMGVKKSKPPVSIENPQVYFLKGACVAGKLEGDIELLGEYVSVISIGNNVTRIPKRVLTRTKVVNGKTVGLIFRASISGQSQDSNPMFGIIVGSAAAEFSLSEEAPYTRSVTISYTRSEVPGDIFTLYRSTVEIYQWVHLNQPIRGDRWKQITYHGPIKAQVRSFKGDKLHGKTNQFAYTFTSGQGFQVPMTASEFCYDEGEVIKSVTCDVE